MGRSVGLFQRSRKAIIQKKIPIVLLVILLLLVPTFMALIHIHLTDNTITVFSSEKISVELTDSEGVVIAKEESSSEYVSATSLVGLFQRINETKIKSARAVSDFADRRWVKASFTKGQEAFDLTCYFSLSANDSYCVDKNGQTYRIEQEVCDRFFSTKYAEPFYVASKAPELTTVSGTVILPSSLSWKYQNWNGEFTDSLLNQTSADLYRYDMQGAVSLNFSQEPDTCDVQIYNKKGSLIYEGDHRNLQTLVGDSSRVKVTAVWNQKEGATFFGSATYDFSVQIRDHAVFQVNTSSVVEGGAILLSCTNISDLSGLSFVEAPNNSCKLGQEPSFSLENGTARAWLTFPEGSGNGQYRFTVSYGASSKTITLMILPATEPTPHLLERTVTELAGLPLTDARKRLREMAKAFSLPQNQVSVFFPDKFHSPTADGFQKGYSYGTPLTSSDGFVSFLSYGTEYRLSEGQSTLIGALNSGLVLKTGKTDLLGNYVIVDHGLGLRTWYCHLSSLDVLEGDYVIGGQSVGKAGQHVTASGNGFLLLCSIDECLLNPSFLFTN